MLAVGGKGDKEKHQSENMKWGVASLGLQGTAFLGSSGQVAPGRPQLAWQPSSLPASGDLGLVM